MRKLRFFVFLIAATFFLAPSAASAQAMRLLTRNSGWFLLYGRLYWTNDFGHDWRSISPPGAQIYGPYMISDVFFLNTSDGWALLVRRSSIATGTFDDALAATHDAGITWSVTALHVASPHPGSMPLAGSGTVFFHDRTHGWIDLGVVSSLAVMHGLLFSTGERGDLAPRTRRSANRGERSLRDAERRLARRRAGRRGPLLDARRRQNVGPGRAESPFAAGSQNVVFLFSTVLLRPKPRGDRCLQPLEHGIDAVCDDRWREILGARCFPDTPTVYRHDTRHHSRLPSNHGLAFAPREHQVDGRVPA